MAGNTAAPLNFDEGNQVPAPNVAPTGVHPSSSIGCAE
jgi:hypothetical protein